MLSDGDSCTHKHLCDLCVYCSNVEIAKEECVTHVAKRMGTALRKLATEGKKSGTTLGGREYGKLKQATITQLTGYYGKAIRGHPGDLDAMRNAVFATFFHAASECQREPALESVGEVSEDRLRWLSACRGSNLCSDRRVQPGGRVYGGAHIRHHGHGHRHQHEAVGCKSG